MIYNELKRIISTTGEHELLQSNRIHEVHNLAALWWAVSGCTEGAAQLTVAVGGKLIVEPCSESRVKN